jgi:hypothetical protein
MLPLNLTIEDYSSKEKIAYLPRKLTEEDGGPFSNEARGISRGPIEIAVSILVVAHLGE